MTPLIRSFILLAAMMAAATGGATLKPTIRLSDGQPVVNLEEVIPKEFGDWKMDTQSMSAVINPQQQALLNTLYSQTLSRTYIHKSGRRIMLSLAYGGDQSHDTQIHKPEVCYPAQGFRLLSSKKDTVQLLGSSVPVMRIITELGPRHEPVTYWIRVGDKVVRGAIEQNLARMSIAMGGHIPDGMLFRVSEISQNDEESFVLQDAFIQAILPAVNAPTRQLLVGRLADPT